MTRATRRGRCEKRPAVSIAIAKRKGANAVMVADDILQRLEIVKGRIVPDDLEITVTRNYGETATEKANELLFHLALATLSIVVLIALTIGWREGVVVFVIIPTTILLTMFASWLMGYTINRVSLFALIFSIGILVDDAIVVVENIVRHWHDARRPRPRRHRDRGGGRGRQSDHRRDAHHHRRAAADDVRVSGLMGPYMSPIPANASMAMVFSFFVAVTITPWLLLQHRAPALRTRKAAHARRRARHRRDGPLLCAHRRPLLKGAHAVEAFSSSRSGSRRSPPARCSRPRACA